MPEQDKATYSVVGMMPISLDVPSFCTPLFRNDDGDKYFLQSLQLRRKIESFVFIGDNLPSGEFIRYRHNGYFHAGGEPLLGFKFGNGSILFDTKRKVHRFLIDNIHEFVEYPFLFFQIARLSRKNDFIQKALMLDAVNDAVSKGWITLKKGEPRFVWTKANTQKLMQLVARGKSTSVISRELGISRNSVLSKLKRLRLHRDGDSADLFSSLPPTRGESDQ